MWPGTVARGVPENSCPPAPCPAPAGPLACSLAKWPAPFGAGGIRDGQRLGSCSTGAAKVLAVFTAFFGGGEGRGGMGQEGRPVSCQLHVGARGPSSVPSPSDFPLTGLPCVCVSILLSLLLFSSRWAVRGVHCWSVQRLGFSWVLVFRTGKLACSFRSTKSCHCSVDM